MIRTLGARLGAVLFIGVAFFGLSACGKTIDEEAVQKAVSDTVSENFDYQPTDMKCPSGLDAKVGVEFDCTFTGPEDEAYLAHVKITKVDGSDLEYEVETKPAT